MSIDILQNKIIHHLSLIYPSADHDALADAVIKSFFGTDENGKKSHSYTGSDHGLSERDSMLITYADSLRQYDKTPLQTLRHFLDTYIQDQISSVHILPFFPYSSDDGFAVIDYDKVRDDLGSWDDVNSIGYDYKLMLDLVINHASSQSSWFKKTLAGDHGYKNFFKTAELTDDVSAVTRPRSSPLLVPFETDEGIQHFWCTFGPDQIDFDFSNPDVLLAFIDIMRLYLDHNVRIFRLDAVAFLWKEAGTACMHLPQTHEIIRLLRTLIDFDPSNALIITETNVPNHENVSYFGNGNEAHLIYNFSLPPLLVQALLTGNAHYLKRWLMHLPPTREGCAYLNFTASHDGIGLRPASGLLSDDDFQQMLKTIRSFGGEISMRSVSPTEQRPYEMNISLFDAFKGTIKGEDDLQKERFLASQTIMMALEGLPAFYIHSLLSTRNDTENVKNKGYNRAINRHQWDYDQLQTHLNEPLSDQSYVFNRLMQILSLRKQQKAFHPNATQFTLHLPEGLFGFWRQSLDRSQDIFCITNLTDADQTLPLHLLNLHIAANWTDILTGQIFPETEQDIILAPYQSLWISNLATPL